MENDINNLTQEEIDEIIKTKIAPNNEEVAKKLSLKNTPNDVVLSKDVTFNVFGKILSYFQCVGLIFFIIVSMVYTILKYDIYGYRFLSVDSYMILNLSTYVCLALTGLNLIFNIIKAIVLKSRWDTKTVLKNCPEFVFLLLALIYTIISTFAQIKYTQSPYVSRGLLIYGNTYNVEGLIAVLMYAVIFLTSYTVMNDKAKQLVIASMFITGITTSVIMFILAATVENDVSGWISYRLSAGIFNNSNHYGYWTCILTCLAAASVVFSKKLWQTIFASIMLVPFLLCLLVSKTLGSNLGFVFCIIFIIIAYIVCNKKFTWKIILLIAISVITFAISESTEFTNMMADYKGLIASTQKISESIQTGDTESAYTAGSSRWGLWINTIKVCFESPWIGKGLDCYYDYNYYDASLDMPHNEYIQLASNVGIPVLIFYLAAILSTFIRAIIYHKKLSNTTLICLAVTFGYCVSAFFGNTFIYTYPYFLIFFGLAIPKISKETFFEKAQRTDEFKLDTEDEWDQGMALGDEPKAEENLVEELDQF